MATPEERHKILEMVASGALNAGEAADLLAQAVPETPVIKSTVPEPDKSPPESPGDSSAPPRWLKIRVGDLESGRGKVSVNIPLRLMQFGFQVGRGFVPELEKVDWDALSATLTENEQGLLIDVQDEEDGERVRIYVE